jgi:DNA-binding NtrC family response regulator
MSRIPPFSNQRILVIDDDPVVCLSCTRILSTEGHQIDCQQNPAKGLEAALSGSYDIILLDIVMPDIGGAEVLKKLKAAGTNAEIIIITGYSTVQTAVETMKDGAADYLSKPFTPDELKLTIEKVATRSALLKENAELRRQLEIDQGFETMIGKSRPMERVFFVIRRVAPTQSTVLITGESGTGKELVARAVHRLSSRRNKAILACDCSSLVPTLLESELFGHVAGAFSGAVGSKRGLFRTANGGTLFLDEISNVSLETQGKLLRVLETRRVKPVGDTSEVEVDIRLIAATNRDLHAMVEEGTFREDLYYRLNVVPIHVPPLRERMGDFPILLIHFAERFCSRNKLPTCDFTPEAMQVLEDYQWPGNVRELKNMVERLTVLSDSSHIDIRHLPSEMLQPRAQMQATQIPHDWEQFKDLKRKVRDATVDTLEKRFLIEALSRAQGNVSQAAKEVGMQRTNFHSLMRKHNI